MHIMPRGRSFIGLPTGREGIDAAWLTSVIRDLLGRHERVLVLLESELMSYERGAGQNLDVPVLSPTGASDRVTEETMARWREVDVVRHALPVALQPRVQIASWAHFIDPTFAGLWRQLLAASAVESGFRTDVLRQGQVRRSYRGDWAATAQAARQTSLCAVETLAMRLRIGEVAGYHHEYGASGEGLLAERLYAGAYAADGLTVESLVGQPARRSYRAL